MTTVYASAAVATLVLAAILGPVLVLAACVAFVRHEQASRTGGAS